VISVLGADLSGGLESQTVRRLVVQGNVCRTSADGERGRLVIGYIAGYLHVNRCLVRGSGSSRTYHFQVTDLRACVCVSDGELLESHTAALVIDALNKAEQSNVSGTNITGKETARPNSQTISFLEPFDTIPQLNNLPRNVATQDTWKFIDVQTHLHDLPVEGIQSRGVNLEENLSLSWPGDWDRLNLKVSADLREEESLLLGVGHHDPW